MHVTSDIIQTIWIVSPLTCKVIRRQIDIWIVSVVSILWILIPVSHLDSVSSVFLLDYGSHALALDCDPGLTLDSVYISLSSGRNSGTKFYQLNCHPGSSPFQRYHKLEKVDDKELLRCERTQSTTEKWYFKPDAGLKN